MGRLEKAVGLALIAVGVLAAWWRPPSPVPRPGRVLVLLDDAVKSAPGVREAFVDPGPRTHADGANFRVCAVDEPSWNAVAAVEFATQAALFEAVVVVSDGRADMDASAGQSIGAALAARGVPVSVVLTPVPPPPIPLPPALQPARPLRVLYVEQSPRWEYHFLSNAMCRDTALLAHTWLTDTDQETPQRRTKRDGWPAIDLHAGLASPTAMEEYDVLVLGDVGVDELRGPDTRDRDVAAEIRAWVESGRGLLVIAGPQRMPLGWTETALADVLPVVPDDRVFLAPEPGPAEGFHLRLTDAGAASRLLDIADDPEESRRLWETSPNWAMYWAAPVKVREGATELAQAGAGAYEGRSLLASGNCGKGRVLFLGVDELWRIRSDMGDRFFWRFYAAAIGWLAEPRVPPGPAPEVKPPEPQPVPPGSAALRALAEASGGRVCGPGDAADLVDSLRATRGPAPAAPAREPSMVAAGVATALCGAFFLLRGRAT